LLVNTLPAEKFAKSKLLGAVNIPQQEDDFAARVLQRAGSKDKTIVVYCASRECDSSHKAAQKLLDAAFEDIRVFEEGSDGWQQFAKSSMARLAKW
jgi:rhodanese-related sulfurtransferase